MKILFFIIWDDANFYNSLVFLSKYLSNKDNKIYIFCKKPEKDKDIVGQLDFGKNSEFV